MIYAMYIKENTEQGLLQEFGVTTLEDALTKATAAQVFHQDYTWENFTANCD